MSIQASVPPPAGFQSKGRARAAANNAKYGTPLPILLPESPLYASSLARLTSPSSSPSSDSPSSEPRATIVRTGLFGLLGPRAIIPHCHGVLDRSTQSVWVEDEEDMRVLFNRGFFGKGSLSRSDPSWKKGKEEMLRGGDAANAERIREQRRKERKQFKIDRAKAMLEAAKKAEAVLTKSQAKAGEVEAGGESKDGEDGEGGEQEEGAEATVAEDGAEVTEAVEGSKGGEEVDQVEEVVDTKSLTPQTFLVRPQRPDANRNRGRKPKRRPPPQAQGQQPSQPGAPAEGAAGSEQRTPTQPRRKAPEPVPEPESSSSEDEAARLVEEREHLQLSYPEALFLCSLGVLKILDPETDEYIPQGREVMSLLTPIVEAAGPAAEITPAEELLPDDPLLVNYAAYQHYRALGWCVRSGVKFCVDWLLYRRGPVFSHSAFSVLIIPVYATDADRALSPYAHTDFYAEKISWKWMNTIMRVNSLVMKTVVVAYVTIPSRENFKTYGGDMRRIVGQYGVREVSLMRFSPARRRD